jgi:hypothetical protein
VWPRQADRLRALNELKALRLADMQRRVRSRVWLEHRMLADRRAGRVLDWARFRRAEAEVANSEARAVQAAWQQAAREQVGADRTAQRGCAARAHRALRHRLAIDLFVRNGARALGTSQHSAAHGAHMHAPYVLPSTKRLCCVQRAMGAAHAPQVAWGSTIVAYAMVGQSGCLTASSSGCT